MKTIKHPKYVWADYDKKSALKWAFYNSKADQQGNRPDLKPIKFKLVLVK